MAELHESIISEINNLILVVNQNLEVVFANTGFGKFKGRRSADFKGRPLGQILGISKEQWEFLECELRGKLYPAEQISHKEARANFSSSIDTRDPLKGVNHNNKPENPPSVITLGEKIFTYQVFDLELNGEDYRGLIFNDLTKEKHFLDRMTQAENIAGLKTLVAGISHEISNPLHSILSFAEAMEKEKDMEKIQHYASRVAELSSKIGKKFSEFSGYVQSKGSGTSSLIDVEETLCKALNLTLLPLKEKSIEIEKDISPLPKVEGDFEEIQQIWVNILNNAVQAMKGCGKLKIYGRESNGLLTIIISDNGPGMARETLRKVFNPFFTTKMQGEGTGLGLSITQRLVEKYGGHIELKSQEGQGTTVSISFPAKSVSKAKRFI